MRYGMVAVVLFATGLTTSCAHVPTALLASTAAEQCEQNRGAAWRPALSYCEYGSIK